VSYGGRTCRVGQSNNVFIFLGVGLGALVADAREVTDGMCLAAAECLGGLVNDSDLASGSRYPSVREIRGVAGRIAEAVVRAARDDGVGQKLEGAEIPRAVAAARWEPRYRTEVLAD
jgi:malic enzyme